MTLRAFVIVAVLATAPGWVAVAGAQTSFVDLELGYQWVDVSGNEDMYRTQLDDDENGLVIRDLSMLVVDSGCPVLDRFRLDASGFGGSPAGRLSLAGSLDEMYSMTLQYRRMETFSALPGWANPLVEDGVSPGLHTSDRTRQMLDLEVEVLPGRVVTPIIGLAWSKLEGPGRTTYHVGQDELRLASELEETERELRVGAAFRVGTFRGSILQGWRDLEVRETLRLAPGEGDGVNPGTVLGTDVTVDELGRTVRTDADTPVTTANLVGTLGSRVRLQLAYARADLDSETSSDETLSGSLVSFRISRFFAGLDESISGRTESPSWRGAVHAGIDIADNVVLDLGYQRRHRELEGWALISSLYLDTLRFSGADAGDVNVLVEAENAYERDEDVLDATLRVSQLGPVYAWAGWSMTDTSLDVAEDVAQIVVAGGQSGSFDREIDSLEVGAGVELGDLKLSLDYATSDADRSIMRTDYLDRSRVRGRVDWHPVEWLTVLATAEQIEAENDTTGIDLDSDTDHWAVDLDLRPVESFLLRLAWDRFETTSTTWLRQPQDYAVVPSVHEEEGELLEGSIQWQREALRLSAGYSTLDNDGSLPFTLDRVFGRVAYDVTQTWGAALEVEAHDYTEEGFALADFDATRYGVYLRWRR
jgi:hypothetical protein